jgi:hypothetical protein
VLLIDNSPNFDAGPAWNFPEDTARFSVEVKATDARK